MIIGNNDFNKDNFQNKMNAIKNNASNMNNSNMNYTNTNQYKDITNQDEMIERSIEMLEERLSNGLISPEEFQKQCAKLGKLRK